jgi:hypothetical protein
MIVILPREYRIKPDFCNVCAHRDTDVLLDPRRAEPDKGERVMGQALRFIPPDANFDPETAAMLGAVLDKVIASLRDGGHPEIVREAIAKRIITLAANGERNPDLLYEAVLAALGVHRPA